MGLPAQTDDTHLCFQPNDVLFSEKGKTTVVRNPATDVAYDFSVEVHNNGPVRSGPFLVRFELSGGASSKKEFKHDKGLNPRDHVRDVTSFSFQKAGDYRMKASLYSSSGRPIGRPASSGNITVKDQLPQSDGTFLCFSPNDLHLSKKGQTGDDAPPHDLDIDYDFWVWVLNNGPVRSGPFSVWFELSRGASLRKEFKHDKGLNPGERVRAVVTCRFPRKENYALKATIHPRSGKPPRDEAKYGNIIIG